MAVVVPFENARLLRAARRLEAAARARHDWVAQHRDEFVRMARQAARDARTPRNG